MSRTIPLTRGLTAIVDEEDYDFLSKWKWRADTDGYAVAWVKTDTGRKTVKMHRFLLGINDSNIIVDHIDGIKHNNVRSNLRTCSRKDNAKNRKSSDVFNGHKVASKYKGVTYVPRDNKWRAVINHDGIRESLGNHLTEEEAALAYNEAAIKYHGKFAKLNKILPKVS